VKRNTIVTGVVLLILATFAWAGWANWEYRRQAADKRLAGVSQAELVEAGDAQAALNPLVGKPAPQFSLEDLSGKKVSLADYKGKAVLINFWATWCGPCKLETPWLVDLRNQYAGKGFEILGVSTDDIDRGDAKMFGQEKKEISDFVQRMHMPYPVLIEGDSVSKPYGGLDAMPTSFFVDRSGKIVAATMGITSKDDIEANIEKALGSAS
jgi:cytochrome c biogenesis protein CcmG/thiol:disulfide interchange protein DsbE